MRLHRNKTRIDIVVIPMMGQNISRKESSSIAQERGKIKYLVSRNRVF